MQVVVIADYRMLTWDEQVRTDPQKIRLPERAILSMELLMDDRYLDVIDLVNYANRDCTSPVVSRDEHVTLNGLFLSSFLMKNGYHPHLIRNFLSAKDRLRSLVRSHPLAVVISTTFLNLTQVQEICRFIRGFDTEVPLIIGGPTIFTADRHFPQLLLSYARGWPNAYIVVENRGEHSLLRLLDQMRTGRNNIGDVVNVIRVDDDGELIRSAAEPETQGINDFIIDWSQCPEEALGKVTSLQTSRGCPFRCEFCTFWIEHPKTELKTEANLVTELSELAKHERVRHVLITDDLLNISIERLKSVCKTIIDSGLSVGLSANIRTKTLDEESVRLMKQANFVFVSAGFESFDDTVLQNMNKAETSRHHVRAIALLRSAGIPVLGTFLFGYPGETERTLCATISQINESGIDFTEIYSFIYYPYAIVGQKARQYGLDGSIFCWRHNSMDSRNLTDVLLPRALDNLENLGTVGWENRGALALLAAHGFNMDDARTLFSIRRELVRIQCNRSITQSEANRLKEAALSQVRQVTSRTLGSSALR